MKIEAKLCDEGVLQRLRRWRGDSRGRFAAMGAAGAFVVAGLLSAPIFPKKDEPRQAPEGIASPEAPPSPARQNALDVLFPRVTAPAAGAATNRTSAAGLMAAKTRNLFSAGPATKPGFGAEKYAAEKIKTSASLQFKLAAGSGTGQFFGASRGGMTSASPSAEGTGAQAFNGTRAGDGGLISAGRDSKSAKRGVVGSTSPDKVQVGWLGGGATSTVGPTGSSVLESAASVPAGTGTPPSSEFLKAFRAGAVTTEDGSPPDSGSHVNTDGKLGSAALPKPELSALAPDKITSGIPVTLTASGKNFEKGAELVYSGPITGSLPLNCSDDKCSTLTANGTLDSDTPPGAYTGRIRNPDGQFSNEASFSVEASESDPPADLLAVIAKKALLGGFRNLYSPFVLHTEKGDLMWTGGWLAETDIEDRIYVSRSENGSWTPPELCFERPGFHINDPSVVRAPNGRKLYMYYTSLDQRYAGNPTENNVMGLAVSGDGGVTWKDHGIVIDQDNGLDSTGAWSPSAVVVGDEIWVYFHTAFGQPGTPQMRVRFAPDGVRRLGKPERLEFPAHPGEALPLVNLDVIRDGKRFVMLANTASLTSVYRFTSRDGLNWDGNPEEPLVTSGANKVLTPHLQLLSPGTYQMYFGYVEGADLTQSRSIQAWTYKEESHGN